MNHFTFSVTSPVNKIKFIGQESSSQLESDSSDNTDIVIDEQLSLDKQIEILEKALEQTREDAYQAGFNEGQILNEKNLQIRIGELNEDFSQLAEGLSKQYKSHFKDLEKKVLSLSLRIAQKVVQCELSHKKNITAFLTKKLKNIIEKLIDQKKIIVQLNSEWLKEFNKDVFLDKFNVPIKKKITFQEDKNLNLGEYIVESEDSLIDGTLDQQLAVMDKHLKKEYLKWS